MFMLVKRFKFTYRYGYTRFSPRLFDSLNVHSTLRNLNREDRVYPSWFDSRPWIHYNEDLTLCLSTRELFKESCAAKI